MFIKAPLSWKLPGVAIITLVGFSALAEIQRAPNTTLTNMPPKPPTHGYATVAAFPGITFTSPTAITSPPGETNRLFVAQQNGVIVVITNLASPTRTIFLDIDNRVVGPEFELDEGGLLGMAFHPGFATNGFFYVFYTGWGITVAEDLHDIVSSFQVSATDANQALPDSETFIIRQRDERGHHNGGDIKFGPDGYLYITVGDEGVDDAYTLNSQVITNDLFSGILRIDVDKRPGSLPPNLHPASTTNYAIPPDNPFIGVTHFNGALVDPARVRTEFWAVGLRNPWRISFDPATGTLYCGDVGEFLREEINIIVKGGNYGWPFLEGTVNGPTWILATTNFPSIPPLLDYTHGSATNQGFAVVGGGVYRGTRFSQLFGAYIFGDYLIGNLWALKDGGSTVSSLELLMVTPADVITFGTDPRDGDVLLGRHKNDTPLLRLVSVAGDSGPPIPSTLADTGAFSDLIALQPHAGIVPYDINVSFWSDFAAKRRWFSLPDTNLTIGFQAHGNWSFPTGSVWIKHFDLELTNGVSDSRKRLETRLLVRNADGVYGVTYRWGDLSTNATLVPEQGMDETFIIDAGGGILRTQVWHYPSRTECLVCHTPAAGFILGFNTPQLNRDFDPGSGPYHQISSLSDAGYFNTNVTDANLLPALASASDPNISLEYRVRSFLQANCAQCHQPGGPALGLWDARISTPGPLSGIIEGDLVNYLGNPANRVIRRGSPELSMILQRIAKRGPGQMPPVASSVLDTQAIALVSSWITNSLTSHRTYAEWQIDQFGSTNAPGAGPDEDFDNDGDGAYLEFLNRTDPKNSLSRWRISLLRNGDVFSTRFPSMANRNYTVEYSEKLSATNTWRPLDVFQNAPLFLNYDTNWAVPDIISKGASRFYRVTVSEP